MWKYLSCRFSCAFRQFTSPSREFRILILYNLNNLHKKTQSISFVFWKRFIRSNNVFSLPISFYLLMYNTSMVAMLIHIFDNVYSTACNYWSIAETFWLISNIYIRGCAKIPREYTCQYRAAHASCTCAWTRGTSCDARDVVLPFDLFLALECNRGSDLKYRGRKKGDALHVFWLINIRKNPLNWVIKRPRRDFNGQQTLCLLFPILTALFYFCHRICKSRRRHVPSSVWSRLDVQPNLIRCRLV